MKSKYLAYGARSEIGEPFFSNGVILTAAVIRTSEPSFSRKTSKRVK